MCLSLPNLCSEIKLKRISRGVPLNMKNVFRPHVNGKRGRSKDRTIATIERLVPNQNARSHHLFRFRNSDRRLFAALSCGEIKTVTNRECFHFDNSLRGHRGQSWRSLHHPKLGNSE